jgi:mRNA interferase RelE/StbE
MKQIAYSRAALKTLSRIPANTASLIRSKIEQYAADPASLANNVTELVASAGLKRLRVGDWRVIFTEDGEIIAIEKVAPRGRAYN